MALILIPARYESSRFPGKPLANIAGRPLIQRVFEQFQDLPHQVCVVTNNSEIESFLQKVSIPVARVDDEVISGTERIYLAWKRFFPEAEGPIVNIQGDEPLLKGKSLEALISFHRASHFDLTTLVRPKLAQDLSGQASHIVKAVFNPETGHCQDFTRKAPEASEKWYQHIGVYCFTPSCLEEFYQAPPSEREKAERLEQLRVLEAGKKIGAIPLDYDLVGVDIPEDIDRVEELIHAQA